MFEREREQLNYDVALNTLKDEAGHKTMLLEQYIYEFARIIKIKNKPEKQTLEIVKLSRKIIEEGERILVVIEEYLQELGMGFLHQLISELYKAFVLCFHSLSDNFSVLLLDRKLISPSIDSRDEASEKKSFKMSQKELWYLDSTIKDLEEQEQKIEEKKKLVDSEILLQNKAYMNITSSDAARQLESINNQLLKIVINSDTISGENVLYRYQDLSRKMLNLKKPEQIQDEFCSLVSSGLRSKFVKGMERIAKETSILSRNKERKAILEEIEKSKVLKISSSTQTEQESKSRTKQIDLLTRQNKNLIFENENMKKIIEQMTVEIKNNGAKLRLEESMNESLTKKLDSFEDQLVQKMNEIDHFQKENEDFKEQVKAGQTLLQSMKSTPRRISEEVTLPKCKTLMRATSITNMLEYELKAKSEEAEVLRENFVNLLSKLKELEICGNFNIDSFEDLDGESFNERIEEFIKGFEQNCAKENIQSEQTKASNENPKQSIEIPQLKSTETQTFIAVMKDECIQTIYFGEHQKTESSSKVEDMKKNLLVKLDHRKKNSQNSKRIQKYTLNEGRNLNDSKADNVSEIMSQENNESTKKSKTRMSKLAISFEEFNFSSNNMHNGQSLERRNMSKIGKKIVTHEEEVSENSSTERYALKRESMKPKLSREASLENVSYFAKIMR